MKKITAAFLALAVTIVFTVNSFAQTLNLSYDGNMYSYSGKSYILKVNGEVVTCDVPPVVVGNSLMVPARAFFEKLGAVVSWNSSSQKLSILMGDKNIIFKANDQNVTINDKTATLSYPAKLVNGRLFFDVSFISLYLDMRVVLPGDGNVITVDKARRISSVQFSVQGDDGGVLLNLDSYDNYNVFRLTGPDRIVIDIPNFVLPNGDTQQRIDVNKGYIKAIRYFQFQGNMSRIVLDVTGQPAYEAVEGPGKLGLYLSNPGYKNMSFVHDGDRVALILSGAKLTEGGSDLQKFYTENYEADKKRYTITFPSNLADIGAGTMKINDGVLDSIQVVNKGSSGNTSIVFYAKDRFSYVPVTRPLTGDTAITIVKPAAKGEKLVVIDAGHGGSAEPGAVYGGVNEKDLNLDITLRLNKLLKSQNIKTYMIRESDSYVWFYERAFIANALNATLFLSVHNNALPENLNYGGTMSLYFPSNSSSFNGTRYAQIVQSNLLKALGTTDRKVVERPDLVVLNATDMPSVLAEVAFMTNKSDMKSLQNPNFRQKAANALCTSVVQALKEVK